MNLLFKLSMPNNNSWNGKWSGEDKFYGVLKSFSTKKQKERAAEILQKGYFYYNFGDGWGMGITVSEVSPENKRKVKKQLQGFYSYEWAISSIEKYGDIRIDS